jgi:DNA repair protein RecO (recombination protein O)
VPIATTESIVLKGFAYGDTSRILRLLTRQHGVQSVIAKGALRPRSRFGGVLDPFTEGVATFYLREGRDLHTLSAFELLWSPHRLGRDLVAFGGASLLAEIVLRTASEQPDPPLYDAMKSSLRRLAEAEPRHSECLVLAETWSLIDRLGFAPALEDCIACGRSLGTTEIAAFDYAAGGGRCVRCTGDSPGRPLPPAARAALLALSRGEAVTLPQTAAHWRLLARYLLHHVVEGDPLHALAFLAETLGGRAGPEEPRRA